MKVSMICSNKECKYCDGTGRIRVENVTTNTVSYFYCFGDTMSAMPIEDIEALLNSDKNPEGCDTTNDASIPSASPQNLTSELEDFHKEQILDQLTGELFSLQNENGGSRLFTDECDMLAESIYKNVFLPKLTEYKSLIEKLKEENEKLWQTLKLIRSVYPDQLKKLETGLERLQQEKEKLRGEASVRRDSNVPCDAPFDSNNSIKQ